MEKKINLSVIILGIIESICYFTPFCLGEQYWKYDNSKFYHGLATVKSTNGISCFEIQTGMGKYFAIFLVCTALVTVAVYCLKAMNYHTVITEKAWIVSIVHTVTMVLFLYYSCEIALKDTITCYFTYTIGWMYYIIIALNVIPCLLAILLRFGKLDLVLPKWNQSADKKHPESLDELLTYKELLDAGVLTAEEFEEKKKKLLDAESVENTPYEDQNW